MTNQGVIRWNLVGNIFAVLLVLLIFIAISGGGQSAKKARDDFMDRNAKLIDGQLKSQAEIVTHLSRMSDEDFERYTRITWQLSNEERTEKHYEPRTRELYNAILCEQYPELANRIQRLQP